MENNPKEKANSLIEKFKDYVNDMDWNAGEYEPSYSKKLEKRNAIECALMLCDELIGATFDNHVTIGRKGMSDKEFWQSVRKELELLKS